MIETLPTETHLRELEQLRTLEQEEVELLKKGLRELLVEESIEQLTERAYLVSRLYWSAATENTTQRNRFSYKEVDIYAGALFYALNQRPSDEVEEAKYRLHYGRRTSLNTKKPTPEKVSRGV